MEYGCPGCKLTIKSPTDGRVVIPAHRGRGGNPCCWGGRPHTVKAASVHSPENVRRRRVANEAKKRGTKGKTDPVLGSDSGPVSDAAIDAYRATLKGKE